MEAFLATGCPMFMNINVCLPNSRHISNTQHACNSNEDLIGCEQSSADQGRTRTFNQAINPYLRSLDLDPCRRQPKK
eukprot:3731304-Amphidinium_carterae.1